jgi:hypothetical protein
MAHPTYRLGHSGPIYRMPSGSSAPYATGGKAQPRSPHGPKLKPKKVKIKSHTRTVTPKVPAAPVNPDQALIDAAVRLHFGPQEQGLRNQLSQNAMYSQGLPGWYQQATDEIRRLQQGANAGAQQTLGQITAYNSPATLANPTDQQAANARNNLNAAFAAKFGADANSNSAALDRIAAAMAVQQANQAGQAQLQRIGLYGQQGQLGQEKADYGQTYGASIQQARDKAAADALKTDLAAKALGLKVDTLNKVQIPLAQSLEQNRTAGQKVARTNAREKQRHDQQMEALGTRNADISDWKAHHPNAGKKGAGSNSTYSKSKIQGFRQNWDYAKATAHQLKEKGTYTDKQGKVQNISTDVAYSALLNATKDPDIARAAAYVAFRKPIPADLRHRLAVKGIHVADPKVGRTPGGGPYGTGHMEN